MAEKVLPGYDTSWGNKKAYISDHQGPNPYLTGGETFSAARLGWGGLDWVEPSGLSYNSTGNGTYYARTSYPTGTAGAMSSVKIKWFVAANDAEVANNSNLSGESLRLLAVGV